ncbi:ABC transporter permease [Virgisporangium aurantiacum]|uniref:ABC transporter substrate-binding protein n=1 Tax=Virgisporangium aurantiacum TaxID=175570 RepID=A0A8J3Z6W0_9ACTN|nr:ABC transporter permease [Virgisporangium aurantiacum]GIJ56015.1 ABC transporter substrate-binding protein [Virgisporangium aurantiacum]
MLRYTLASVLAHKGRLLLTAVAIVLGVGLVAGTFVLIDTWRAAADEAAHRPPRGVDVVVGAAQHGEEAVPVPFRGPVPAALVDRLARVDGVAATTGVVLGRAQVLGRDGHPVAGREPVARTVDPSFAGSLRAGRVPGGPAEVVIDPATAAALNLRVGNRVRVVVAGRAPESVTVVGLLGAPELAGAAFVGLHPGAARYLLPRADQVSFVEVRAASGVSQRELRDRIAAALGGQYAASTGADLDAELARAAEPPSLFARLFLIASLVALFIGTFLIRNTYTIVLASRARELALLRCIGADRRQLRRAVLLEAAVVGAVASLGGLVLGVALGWGVASLLEAGGAIEVDVTGRTPHVLPRTVAVALAAGIVTALVSAWRPARRATLVPPVAALRGDVFALDRRAGRFRTWSGGLLLLAGIGLVLAGGLADPAVDAMVSAGAALSGVGVLVLGPVLALPVARLVGAAVRRGRGVPGRFAADNAVRSPRRAAATTLPLVIGLALIGFVTTLAAGSRASTVGGFDRALRADYQIQAFDPDVAMTPDVPRRLAALPELAAVAAFQAADAELAMETTTGPTTAAGPATVELAAVDPAHLGSVLALPVTGGALSDLADGGIALRRTVARERGATIGSTVRLRTGVDDPGQTFTVRAIYDTSGLGGYSIAHLPIYDSLITPSDYERLVGDPAVTRVYATVRAGVAPAAARAAIARALADQPTVEISDRDHLRRRAAAELAPALRVYYTLFGLMILIALFGIVNTLALSVLERVRELGLLRVLGMQRRQVRTMLRWEAAIMAATGAVVGLALGTLVGWAATRALDLSATHVPIGPLAACAGAAVLAAMLTAGPPARRAARVDVLRALAAD